MASMSDIQIKRETEPVTVTEPVVETTKKRKRRPRKRAKKENGEVTSHSPNKWFQFLGYWRATVAGRYPDHSQPNLMKEASKDYQIWKTAGEPALNTQKK